MRLLLATYWDMPHVGGVWTYLRQLKQELERYGHQVDLFAQHPDLTKYYLVNSEFIVEKHEVKSSILNLLTRFFSSGTPKPDAWILEREAERYTFEAIAARLDLAAYDLIHTQDIVSTRAMWRVKPQKTPLIATIHGCLATEYFHSGEITRKDSSRYRYAVAEEYYGATSCDWTLLPTKWLHELYVNEFNIPKDSLQVVPYGLDLPDLLSASLASSPPLEPATGKIVFVCPARLVPVKGHEVLLNALSALKQEREDWECWLVGDGDLRETLEMRVHELELEQQVIFLGNRHDVPQLLQEANVFVLSSLQDNQPFAVIEAQAAGLPVVASDAGGIPEMVEHSKTGLLFPVGDSNALTALLKEVLSDADLRQRLGTAGQVWARQQWSLSAMVETTLEAYQKAIAKRSGI